MLQKPLDYPSQSVSVDVAWSTVRDRILLVYAANASIPRSNLNKKKIKGVPLTGEVRQAFRKRKKVFISRLRGSTSALAWGLRKNADETLNEAIKNYRNILKLPLQLIARAILRDSWRLRGQPMLRNRKIRRLLMPMES